MNVTGKHKTSKAQSLEISASLDKIKNKKGISYENWVIKLFAITLIILNYLFILFTYIFSYDSTDLITPIQNGPIDSTYYHYLVKNLSYESLLAATPNPQTAPFLIITKAICDPFGCSTSFFVVQGTLILIVSMAYMRASLLFALMVCPLILYIVTPGKEGILLLAYIIFIASKGKSYAVPIFLMLIARPLMVGIFVLLRIINFLKWKILFLTPILLLYIDELIAHFYLYQARNMEETGRTCQVLFMDLCISEAANFMDIFTLIQRTLFGVSIQPAKSLLDLLAWQELMPFERVLNISEAFAALAYYWVIFQIIKMRRLWSEDSVFFLLHAVVVFGLFMFSVERLLPFVYLSALYGLKNSRKIND